MFKSLSASPLNSNVKTGFFASSSLTVESVSEMTFYVNGVQQTGLSTISVNKGDYVEAEVVSANDYGTHDFFEYRLNDLKQHFAVVTQIIFNIRILAENIRKRWYDYEVGPLSASIYLINKQVYFIVSESTGEINFSKNILLDPRSNTVFFVSDTTVTYSLRLNFTPREYDLAPQRDYLYITSNQGLMKINQSGVDTKIVPTITDCYGINVAENKIIVGGVDKVWIIDLTTEEILIEHTLPTSGERIVDVAFSDNNEIVVITDNSKVIKISESGIFDTIKDSSVFGYVIHLDGKSYFPDSLTGEIHQHDHNTGLTSVLLTLEDYSPNNLTIKNNYLYIAGNDSNIIYKIDLSSLNKEKIIMKDKVTSLSVTDNDYIFMSHYLKDTYVLDTRDFETTLPFTLNKRYGPVTHIGSNIITARLLGDTEVRAFTPVGSNLWLNGNKTNSSYDQRGIGIVNGDRFSISYAATEPGLFNIPFVIGDSAFDYIVEVEEETYFPRYIEFPIQQPDASGFCIYEFTMPNKMQPTRMACEYGQITLNGLLYNGSQVVNPNDEIRIVLEFSSDPAFAYGVAPIFTLGSRQFAIPVVANNTLSLPVEYKQSFLDRSTPLIENITISPDVSQHDFIFPHYYDIVFKKNGADISGTYYQQFGKNDVLTIEYQSSSKYYDINDVYILGETSYYFRAENTPASNVDYLDFGNISQPFVRSILGSMDYAGYTLLTNENVEYVSSNIAIPTEQYYTANLSISGLFTGNTANITIYGGDSYIVLNGNIKEERTVEVTNDDDISIARTFLNYFEGNVSLIQEVYDIEGDIQELIVGSWGVINQTIESNEFSKLSMITTPDSKETNYFNNYNLSSAFEGNIANTSTFIKVSNSIGKFAIEPRLKSMHRNYTLKDLFLLSPINGSIYTPSLLTSFNTNEFVENNLFDRNFNLNKFDKNKLFSGIKNLATLDTASLVFNKANESSLNKNILDNVKSSLLYFNKNTNKLLFMPGVFDLQKIYPVIFDKYTSSIPSSTANKKDTFKFSMARMRFEPREKLGSSVYKLRNRPLYVRKTIADFSPLSFQINNGKYWEYLPIVNKTQISKKFNLINLKNPGSLITKNLFIFDNVVLPTVTEEFLPDRALFHSVNSYGNHGKPPELQIGSLFIGGLNSMQKHKPEQRVKSGSNPKKEVAKRFVIESSKNSFSKDLFLLSADKNNVDYISTGLLTPIIFDILNSKLYAPTVPSYTTSLVYKNNLIGPEGIFNKFILNSNALSGFDFNYKKTTILSVNKKLKSNREKDSNVLDFNGRVDSEYIINPTLFTVNQTIPYIHLFNKPFTLNSQEFNKHKFNIQELQISESKLIIKNNSLVVDSPAGIDKKVVSTARTSNAAIIKYRKSNVPYFDFEKYDSRYKNIMHTSEGSIVYSSFARQDYLPIEINFLQVAKTPWFEQIKEFRNYPLTPRIYFGYTDAHNREYDTFKLIVKKAPTTIGIRTEYIYDKKQTIPVQLSDYELIKDDFLPARLYFEYDKDEYTYIRPTYIKYTGNLNDSIIPFEHFYESNKDILTVPLQHFYDENSSQLSVPFNYFYESTKDVLTVPLQHFYDENSSQLSVPFTHYYESNADIFSLPLQHFYDENTTQLSVSLAFEYLKNLNQDAVPLTFEYSANTSDIAVPLGFERFVSPDLEMSARLPEIGIVPIFNLSDKMLPDPSGERLWDNPVSLTLKRGLFLNVADALAAAEDLGYTATPYQVYLTNMYSYRVYIDLTQECYIIRHPYPIKWLIRGG